MEEDDTNVYVSILEVFDTISTKGNQKEEYHMKKIVALLCAVLLVVAAVPAMAATAESYFVFSDKVNTKSSDVKSKNDTEQYWYITLRSGTYYFNGTYHSVNISSTNIFGGRPRDNGSDTALSTYRIWKSSFNTSKKYTYYDYRVAGDDGAAYFKAKKDSASTSTSNLYVYLRFTP